MEIISAKSAADNTSVFRALSTSPTLQCDIGSATGPLRVTPPDSRKSAGRNTSFFQALSTSPTTQGSITVGSATGPLDVVAADGRGNRILHLPLFVAQCDGGGACCVDDFARASVELAKNLFALGVLAQVLDGNHLR